MTKQFCMRFAPAVLVLLGLPALIVPAFRAQSLGTTVTISTLPAGMYYSVDGQYTRQPTSAVWPAGSKHVLSVTGLTQDELQNKTRYLFKDWEYGGQVVPGGSTVTVTADPAQPAFQAVFNVQYALDIVFFSCPDPTNCPSPGTIYVNNLAIISDTELYLSGGSSFTLTAVPSPGYVFAGWSPGAHQTIQGFADSVSLTEPVIVRPLFQPTRSINLATLPAGLQVYADRAPVPTPTTLEWGFNTTHSVGGVTPQQAKDGTWWAFQSWSDGGAVTHAYTVAPLSHPDTLTATYVPVGVTQITTSPAGLKIDVDGRNNWPNYNFPWGIGETHHIEAPAQQTDSQARVWSFASWSNGGPAAQDFVVPQAAAVGGVRLVATYTPVGHLMINSPIAGVVIQVDDGQCTTPCDLQRPTGATVHVVAPASVALAEGSRADFAGWAGSGTSAVAWSGTLGADPVTLNATFRTMNRLSTSAAPSDGALVTLQPASPDGFYDASSSVIATASARPGFRFRNWTGDLTGGNPSGTVAMNTPRAVQAVLDRVPYIAPAGVANAAGTTPDSAVAPGSVISIFGASLAAAAVVGPDSPLPQSLGGVAVRINDQFLPLFFVSPTQINAQLPPDLGPGDQTMVITSQGQPDISTTFSAALNAPGLFQQTTNGIAFVAALHEDGSAVTLDSPALAGELLTVYGTGLGPTAPARPEGFAVPASPAYTLSDSVTVQVGDYTTPAAAAFAAPGRIGIDLVQFRLGSGAPSGVNAPLHITINGHDSNTAALPVQ
jgi:uncharacterized protein (TIGR03437 family)